MKYGETLHQRSPPAWEAHNVDYNEIKAIIKHHTTGVKAAAITIPGQTAHDAVFEAELFRELADQHKRVDLFVRSKSGEIQRRLGHLEKIALHLRSVTPLAQKQTISVKRLERFSRLETDTLVAGELIQALARYIGAQKLAFSKLLKKYRKWTGASQLSIRFENDVVSKPQSFERQELDHLLLQYNEILAAVRAPFEAGVSWKVSVDDPRKATKRKSLTPSLDTGAKPPVGHALHALFDGGMNLELDAAFGSLPFGPRAGHVAYWIHNDNLLQLHILLLQHMRLRAGSSVASTPLESLSQPPSPKDPLDGSLGGSKEINGQVVCDDLATFAKGRSGMTIEQLETRTGHRPEDAAASIRYNSANDCIVTVNSADLGSESKEDCIAMRCRYKQKDLLSLFQPKADSHTSDDIISSELTGQDAMLPNKPELVRSWFASNQNALPLVRIESRKARFGGLANDGNHGVWATLDRDVRIMAAAGADFETKPPKEEFKPFPHAILEVRWEGEAQPELVRELDSSHLVERVPGFSLQVHAVSVLCNSDLPQPYWLSILDRDIRKIPKQTPKATKRRSSLTTSQEDTAASRPSTSAASTANIPSSGSFSRAKTHSSATSLTETATAAAAGPVKPERPKRKGRRSKARHRYLDEVQQRQQQKEQRYWNEFDDGEEGEGDEAYTVFVDPNTPTPFIDGWNALASRMRKAADRAWTYVSSKEKDGTKPGERSPLLPTDYFSVSGPPESPTGDEGSRSTSPDGPRPSLASRYSAFPTYHSITDPLEPLSLHNLEQRDSFLLRCSVAAFLGAFALMLMAGVLELTRRKSYVVAADIGTIFGVVVSMVSAVAGVGLSAARRIEVGWMGRTQAGLAFAMVCLGNGVLVIVLANG